MKNKILICLLVVMMLFVAGCGKKPAEINTPTNTDNNTNTVNDNTNTNNNTQTPSDSLPILEIQQQYKEDLPLGLENNYLKVNGNDIVVRVQTSGSSEQQANGPYFIYYNMYVGNDALGLKCVRDAIYHLEGYGVTMLKEYNEEEDAGVNYEFFEWDFTSSTHKGVDKEYAAISFPAGTEDKPQASLMITTDDGKLLGEFIADVVHDIILTGPDVEKYKNHSGDIVFNSIKDGNITYLTPTEAMYITDANGNKVLNTSLDEIELEEHSVTMDNNKATDTKTGNIYKITNATGKSFWFGKFRHL
jgi:predicted small lipoprotein YifL